MKRIINKSFGLVWLTCFFLNSGLVHAENSFRLEQDDVVAFLGGANMVYLQKAGYLESILTEQFSESSPIFRDLAWEGDTVFRQGTVIERWRERAHFDEDGGLGNLSDQLDRVGATVIISQFGQSESLEGSEHLDKFSEAYSKLIQSWKNEGRKVVLLTPSPFETSSNPHLPNLVSNNSILAQYVNAIQQLAVKHQVVFVDLFNEAAGNATLNGRHIILAAQPMIASKIAKQLGIHSNAPDSFEVLRKAIIEKHRLWLDYWRPTNWKLLFGDDARRQFTKGPISLRDEWLTLPGMIHKAEARIQSIAIHNLDPGPNRPPKEILHGDSQASIEEEMEAFTLPEGFVVNLFASEKQGLSSPLNLRWDPSGRMYVTITTTYPHVFPGDLPNDKIIVLEDRDQDGTADVSTIFADGLNIPTGIEWGNGGIYVGQNTEILFLKDKDGDNQADERSVVLSGFGDGDSHQTINSFIWSPDGQLYFGHGDGCESRVETPWGTSALFNAGYFKLQPKRLLLVPFLEAHMGPGNPWGIGFDAWGQSFGVDGAGGVSWLTPAQVSTTHRRRFPRIGDPGGYCGIGYLDNENLPAQMRGSFVIGDYKANRISRFTVADRGSGFDLTWEEPLMSSSHRNFRPVDVKLGPDGAIYIVDWYNPITCHQDDAFRDPSRDKAHGRIWRVSVADPGNQKNHFKRADLLSAPIKEVIKTLEASDTWSRYQAKRALTARPSLEVEKALDDWVGSLNHKNPKHAFKLYQALMAFATIEAVRPPLLQDLLNSRDMRIRASATQLIGRWHDRLLHPLELLSNRIHDNHARVRLAAIVAFSEIPSAQSIQIAIKAIDHPMDQWTNYALKQTIHRLKPHWLPKFKRGELKFSKPAHLAFILNEIKDEDAINGLKDLLDMGPLDEQTTSNSIIAILANGDPEDIHQYGLDPKRYTQNGNHDTKSHAAILVALSEILESNPVVIPNHNLTPLKKLALHPERSLQIAALKLIGLTKFTNESESVIKVATDNEVNSDVRAAALNALGGLDTARSRDLLIQFARQAKESILRSTAIVSLAEFDIPSAAEAAVDYLSEDTTPNAHASKVLISMTQKAGGPQALSGSFKGKSMSPTVKHNLRRILYATGTPDPGLLAVLNQQTTEEGKERDYSESLVINLAAKAKKDGNFQTGQKIFSQLACDACHQVKGNGGLIGPDLTAIGTTLSTERIIEELLWPGRQVKEGYTPIEIITNDDRILIGYERITLQRADQPDLILRDTVSPELIKINKEKIKSFKKLKSMMPEGLTDRLNEKELLDLIQYLTQLGN